MIERVYLITIERSSNFRSENISKIKNSVKKHLNLDVHTVGVDCEHVYGNPNRIDELKKKGVFIQKK